LTKIGVETEIFSVDERIKIISGIIAIMGKEEGGEHMRKISSCTFMPNPVMKVKLKITRFCNWLQSL